LSLKRWNRGKTVRPSHAINGHQAIEMVRNVSVEIELAEIHLAEIDPVEIDLTGIGVELIEFE
jgi:hypothetical protein